ncbi:MAG: four-carbon acid sugar kinase family protein [Armatimonadetes bacterium]|nr:four-carbon acid sugar kinase family protein [Armatimonadota bacterium]
MSLLPVGITADDLTGAADTAAAFADLRRPVPISLLGAPRAHEGRSAFAVTTESRSASPDDAYALTAASVRALMESGARLIYKKVDSNLRGNVGSELAAARDAAAAWIILAPAFPARGRTTVGGVALVAGTPVAETEMAADPDAPVRHSEIGEIIHSQRKDLLVAHCPLSVVREGAAAIASQARTDGVLVVDAETEADLEAIARAGLSLSPTPVLAGSAGLAAALARVLFGPPTPASWPEGRAGPVLGILASSSQAMASQVARAALDVDTAAVPLPCQGLTRCDEPLPELARAMDQGKKGLNPGHDTLVYAAGPLPEVESPVELVVEHLAHLAFVLVRLSSPVGLLVGGGATASGVLAALGAEAVEVDDEPLPGIAGGTIVGGEMDGRPVVLKPGAAGDEGAVLGLLRYLGRRAAALEDAG